MIYAGFEIEIENPMSPPLDNIYKLIDNTEHITGWKSAYGILQYHASRAYTSIGKWGVEHDASLFSGAEFVTPPVEKNKALDILEEFLSYIDDSGCRVLDSCGLHLNISANNMTVNGMDKSYFLSNINHRLLYASWRHRLRGTNVYCIPMRKVVEYTSDAVDLGTEIQNRMLNGKYRYVNEKITDNVKRLEIRVMGGIDYHRKIEEIRATTNMFCDVLEKSYEETQPRTKKRIVSYINRIQKREPRYYTLWIPTKRHIPDKKTLFYLLDSVKTALEKEKYPENITNMLYRRYSNSPNIWKAYCLDLLHYVENYINYRSLSMPSMRTDPTKISDVFCRDLDISSMKKLVQKTNETLYYVFKHLDKIKYDISQVMFDRFLNGAITGNYKVVLTVPKDEKSTDVLWLCKYSEKLSEKAKKSFVNSLSLSALRFIKKKEIITMRSVINDREKQLIEEKQSSTP